MKITTHEVEEIEIYDLSVYTLDQYVNQFITDESFGWCDGYLIRFLFFRDKITDDAILAGKRKYRGVHVAPMPKFVDEIQTRFTKKPIFDFSGSKIGTAIINHVKELQS